MLSSFGPRLLDKVPPILSRCVKGAYRLRIFPAKKMLQEHGPCLRAWQSAGECDSLFRMANNSTRRNFLRTAPLAAAITLPLAEKFVFASGTGSAAGQSSAPEPFQLFTAGKLADAMKTLQTKPGNDNLYEPKALPLTIVMTTEEKKSGKEFEWHEGRDHIFLILDGETKYEVGGTPKNGHQTKPGEWLAPASEGATSLMLKKGDMLVIPRGTPHKRSTEESVTLYLISTTGSIPA
jgi:mannose-6-phosphate isomerase-like protein (cupin superfamily)